MRQVLLAAGLCMMQLFAVAGADENFLSPQAPHQVTYAKRGSTPGEIVTINGYQFQVRRVPVIDHAGGRYAVTYLYATNQAGQPWEMWTDLKVYHSQEPLVAEMSIDSLPAKLDLFERASPDIGDADGVYFFGQSRYSEFEVTVQVGSARLVFRQEWERLDNDRRPIGETPNAVPAASWWELEEDPTPIRTLDWWIDYIRIYRMP